MTLHSHQLKPRRFSRRILVVVLVVLCLFFWLLTYHGQRHFNFSNTFIPSPENIAHQAIALKGKMYDPMQGGFNNIGGRLGLIVCADVPNISYGRAGFSLKSALREQYELQPTAFDTTNGNTPQNPFFHRRSRNLYAYFKSSGQLIPPNGQAQQADIAFFAPGRHAPVVHVAVVSRVMSDDFYVVESAPETIFAREVSEAAMIKKGWTLVGLGRLSPNKPNN